MHLRLPRPAGKPTLQPENGAPCGREPVGERIGSGIESVDPSARTPFESLRADRQEYRKAAGRIGAAGAGVETVQRRCRSSKWARKRLRRASLSTGTSSDPACRRRRRSCFGDLNRPGGVNRASRSNRRLSDQVLPSTPHKADSHGRSGPGHRRRRRRRSSTRDPLNPMRLVREPSYDTE